MDKQILLIDDEEKLRSLLKRILSLEGFEVLSAQDLHAARQVLARKELPVILCDVKLPDGNGVEFVKWVKAQYPLTEIILLTAYGNIADGVEAMRNGAFDYIVKGDDNDKILPLLNKAFEKVELQSRVLELEKRVGERYSFDNILGNSTSIEQAKELGKKVASTDATVLLLGETGTGKELFAQAIHSYGARNKKPFVAVNCSAFSRDLLESELFGHKAGAFTGALKDKKGLIEQANAGTLFLDELGEMPLELQAKLLRVLESGEFIKVGDTIVTKINVRIIAATNRNLEEEVKAGHFREDLFYRLNVFTIQLPSLEERKTDLPQLANYYLKFFAQKLNRPARQMDADFLKQLQSHRWKGNIRELRNIMERAVILADEPTLQSTHLPYDFLLNSGNQGSSLNLAEIEKQHIIKVLAHAGGNKSEASRLLGIGLTTLYRKIEEYGI